MNLAGVYLCLRNKIETMGTSYTETDGIIRNEEAINDIGCLRLAIQLLQIPPFPGHPDHHMQENFTAADWARMNRRLGVR